MGVSAQWTRIVSGVTTAKRRSITPFIRVMLLRFAVVTPETILVHCALTCPMPLSLADETLGRSPRIFPTVKSNLGHNIFASKETVGIEFTTFFSIHKVYNLMWCIQIASLSKNFCQNLLVSTGSI